MSTEMGGLLDFETLTGIMLEGYPYTWFKSLGKDNAIEEHRDRVMATSEWFDQFLNHKLVNEIAS
jgi:hypothetical protein